MAVRGALLTLCYLFLTILAFGGFRAFFSHAALIALAIAFLAISALSLVSNDDLKERYDGSWTLHAFSVIALLGAIVSPYTDQIDFWTLGGEGIRWLGVALFVAGSLLRLLPLLVLGRVNGLWAINPPGVLITTGIYGFVRHPGYLGLLVAALGWGLAFRSGVGLLLTTCLVPPLLVHMRAEEMLLRARFGAEYEAYCLRTARLIPRVY